MSPDADPPIWDVTTPDPRRSSRSWNASAKWRANVSRAERSDSLAAAKVAAVAAAPTYRRPVFRSLITSYSDSVMARAVSKSMSRPCPSLRTRSTSVSSPRRRSRTAGSRPSAPSIARSARERTRRASRIAWEAP